MNTVQKLIRKVSVGRNEYIKQMELFTEAQAQRKPMPETWNMVENTEHLFWAEQGGAFQIVALIIQCQRAT